MKRSVRSDDAAKEKGRVAKRWVDRAESEGMTAVAGQIPPTEMAVVMEEMFSSMWGGLDDKQMADVLRLMVSWAKQDKEGALAWARNLTVPQQREIALTGIASVVGKDDPMAGFGIYVEIGELNTRASGHVLTNMMRDVYRLAAEKGADAVLDITRRSPANNSGVIHHVALEYPEGFDFAKLMDGLAGISRSNMSFDKSIVPPDPMGQWVLRDPDAAFGYAASSIANGGRVSLSDMAYEVGKKSGLLEARRWMAGKMAAVPSDQIPRFIHGAGLLTSPGLFRQYLQEMPEESAAEFRLQSLKVQPMIAMDLLLDIPSLDDRVALVERLRAVKNADPILDKLRKWEVPQERIDQVGETIRQHE